MKVEPSEQPVGGPPGKPLIENPVKVTLDIPVFYATERGPVPWNHSIICGKAFADTVLKECESLMQDRGLGLVHLGFYNPRQARRKDGTIIQPPRWSNHAYGEAMDFKGVITESGEGEFLEVADMESDVLDKIIESCRSAIEAAGRKPEIVDEGSWYHIGLWPQ